MNHGLTAGTTDRIRSVLARFSEIEKAVLYGSRAKGSYKNGSDIDLTLFGHDLDLSLAKISTALDDLLLPYKIDISIFAQLTHPELIDHIRRVGIVFFDRQAASVKS